MSPQEAMPLNRHNFTIYLALQLLTAQLATSSGKGQLNSLYDAYNGELNRFSYWQEQTSFKILANTRNRNSTIKGKNYKLINC